MTTVQIGDNLFDAAGASSNCPSTPLECDTDYVFRAFVHANSTLQRSNFTGNLFKSTLPCDDDGGGCTYTQGYWKNHCPFLASDGVTPLCAQVVGWPSDGGSLGTVSYTGIEWVSIFNTSGAGNGLVSLAHQLMAAKLNVASGADDTDVAAAIAASDVLIGGLVVPPVGAGSLPNSQTSALTGTLDSFNQGVIGPGHCP
jgi:hypothetical protein